MISALFITLLSPEFLSICPALPWKRIRVPLRPLGPVSHLHYTAGVSRLSNYQPRPLLGAHDALLRRLGTQQTSGSNPLRCGLPSARHRVALDLVDTLSSSFLGTSYRYTAHGGSRLIIDNASIHHRMCSHGLAPLAGL